MNICLTTSQGVCHTFHSTSEISFQLNTTCRSSTCLLSTPPSRLCTVGDRAFSVAGPNIWNALPQGSAQCTSVASFRCHCFRTHQFQLVVPDAFCVHIIIMFLNSIFNFLLLIVVSGFIKCSLVKNKKSYNGTSGVIVLLVFQKHWIQDAWGRGSLSVA